MEQIRVDICYPNLPVIMVGTGSGLSYASLGATHHSLEDIGCMRMLPNMHVVCPGDAVEVKLAVADALRLKRPTYIRLGKKGEPVVHQEQIDFLIGKGIVVKEGTDIALIGVGNMLGVALEIDKILSKQNLSSKLISLHTIKPLDQQLLNQIFNNFNTIVILEEHGLVGGSGSAVLEWAYKNNKDITKLLLFHTPDRFLTGVGNQQEARHSLSLDAKSLSEKIMAKF